MRRLKSWRCGLGAAGVLLVCGARVAVSQAARLAVATTDSITIAAGPQYKVGGVRHLLFGGVYRDLWTTPIRVPVVDPLSFAGGLRLVCDAHPAHDGSVHFEAADGMTYAVRAVDPGAAMLSAMWKGTAAQGFAMQGNADRDPAGPLIAAQFFATAGVLHATPVFVAFADDSTPGARGAVHHERLATLEEDPSGTHDGRTGFAGAIDVIDSRSLLALINADPAQAVDARAFLAARLVDLLLNDGDPGPNQWRWARFPGHAVSPWEPVPGYRDQALQSSSGWLPKHSLSAVPTGAAFRPTYASVPTLTRRSLGFDGRLLGGLNHAAWDSVTRTLVARLTDSAIDAAVGAMPPEYQATAPALVQTLRARRDALPMVATRFYHVLAAAVDIHGTDAADTAMITRVDNDHVEVRLQSGGNVPYFRRTFDARETREIRVYLHGGDNFALARGRVAHSIAVRVIGGNGTNTFIDSSRVGGDRHATHFYDTGVVHDASYGADTSFDRKPQLRVPGGLVDPIRDYGAQGLLTRYSYAFDHYPYASAVKLDGQYSSGIDRLRIALTTDHRFENSPFHITTLAQLSDVALLNFHGYGNTASGLDTSYFAIHQQQWLFHPAIALALARRTDLSFGPVVRYAVTNNAPGQFVSDSQPYGFGRDGRFANMSFRLGLHSGSGSSRRRTGDGLAFDLGASYVPAVGDVQHPFEEIDASESLRLRLALPTHPSLLVRGVGMQLFGEFPFQDAAFIGGAGTARSNNTPLYAGDASLYGTAELRIPLFQVKVLAPIDVGILGAADYGRVFVNGASPGGWHKGFSSGFWIGFHGLTASFWVLRAGEIGRTRSVGDSP